MKFVLRYLIPCLALLLLTMGMVLLAPDRLVLGDYKSWLLVLGGVLGWMLDHFGQPYARPHGYLRERWQFVRGFRADSADHVVVQGCEWLFIAACLRRAAMMAMGMWVMGAGL